MSSDAIGYRFLRFPVHIKKETQMSALPMIISENIEHFTGRTRLLSTLLDWFEKTDERMFILTGEPGTGKSMIMAWRMSL
jgi:hypothetical protein